MLLFDTYVQKLKYKVLKEVARHDYAGTLQDCYLDIPKVISPGPKSTMRCCIYKERAIVAERVKTAMGGDKKNPNVIEVIGIACDECPVSGYRVGPDCRGCIAHRCSSACPRGAISFDDNHHAHIDPDKCINCGKCASVCPYSAIQNHVRPCERACKVKAIQQAKTMWRISTAASASPAARACISAPSAPFRTRAFCWTPSTSSATAKTTRNTRSTPSWPPPSPASSCMPSWGR